MAFDVTVERDGEKAPLKAVVFRKGDTVGCLSAESAGRGEAPGKGGAFEFPVRVHEAQLVNLTRSDRRSAG
jgi:hypothetical protein